MIQSYTLDSVYPPSLSRVAFSFLGLKKVLFLHLRPVHQPDSYWHTHLCIRHLCWWDHLVSMWWEYHTPLLDTEGFYEKGLDEANVYNQLTLSNAVKKMKVFVTQPCLTLETPWTVTCQAPLSTGFSRQEYWNGLAFFFSRGSSRPRDQTHVSCIGRWILPHLNHQVMLIPLNNVGGSHLITRSL